MDDPIPEKMNKMILSKPGKKWDESQGLDPISEKYI